MRKPLKLKALLSLFHFLSFSMMQINAGDQAQKQIITTYSPYSSALETLEKQIKYFLSLPS